MKPAPRKSDFLVVVRLGVLFVAYKLASGVLAWLILLAHGPEAVGFQIRGVGRWAVRGGFEWEVGLAAAVVTFDFCFIFARPTGYHRRDAIFAAIPSVVAPYFIAKIAWRALHPRSDRYWDMPLDLDPFARARTAADASP